jgi:hypothetical protein
MNVPNDHVVIDRETRVRMHNDERWGELLRDVWSRLHVIHTYGRHEHIRSKGRCPAAVIRRGNNSVSDRP